MVLYKDLYKQTDNLFTRDWVHDNCWEIENNWTHSASKVDFKNKQSSVGPDYKKLGNVTEATFKGTCPSSKHSLETSVKLDTKSRLTLDVKARDLLTPGLMFGMKFDFKKGGSSACATTTCQFTKCLASAFTQSEISTEFIQQNTKHPLHSSVIYSPKVHSLNLSTMWKGCCDTNIGGDLIFSGLQNGLIDGGMKWSVGATKIKNGVTATVKLDHHLANDTSVSKLNLIGAVHKGFKIDGGKKIDLAVISNCNLKKLKKSGSDYCCPSFAVCGKFVLSDKLWFKTKICDDLKITGVVGHKCPVSTTESFVGAWVDCKSKNIYDSLKIGAKVVFA